MYGYWWERTEESMKILAESVLTYERNYKLNVWNGRDK